MLLNISKDCNAVECEFFVVVEKRKLSEMFFAIFSAMLETPHKTE